MTSERGLWHTVRRHLSPYGELVRVENAIAAGTPDVAYCFRGRAGWIELKEIESWPRRQGTKVVVPSLTREQVMFLERWSGAGGSAHLLLQGGRDYLLLDAEAARLLWERSLDRQALEKRSAVQGAGLFPATMILRALS